MYQSEVEKIQLIVFRCKELYVYKVPPAGTLGHRAELWDVDHWLQAVSMKIVVQDEDCTIQLFDLESGELFAECPIPPPSQASISTAIDPVVDSSRYFVLKLQDRDTKRHAFIGIGFRTREEASDFNAALSDHLQVIRRTQEAKRLQQEYASATAKREAATASGAVSSGLALEPGETMVLKIKAAESSKTSSKAKLGGSKLQADSRLPNASRLLAPPPAPGEKIKNFDDKKLTETYAEDWGDFAS